MYVAQLDHAIIVQLSGVASVAIALNAALHIVNIEFELN